MVIARKQTLVQLTDELVELLDREAVRRGVSRSALIREAVEEHLHDAREAEISRQIVEGYKRIPPQRWEREWAGVGAEEMLERLAEQEDEAW